VGRVGGKDDKMGGWVGGVGGGGGVELVKPSYSFLSRESMLCVVKYCHVGCCNNMPWFVRRDHCTLPYPATSTYIADGDSIQTKKKRNLFHLSNCKVYNKTGSVQVRQSFGTS
jgi:hypothetical protein